MTALRASSVAGRSLAPAWWSPWVSQVVGNGRSRGVAHSPEGSLTRARPRQGPLPTLPTLPGLPTAPGEVTGGERSSRASHQGEVEVGDPRRPYGPAGVEGGPPHAEPSGLGRRRDAPPLVARSEPRPARATDRPACAPKRCGGPTGGERGPARGAPSGLGERPGSSGGGAGAGPRGRSCRAASSGSSPRRGLACGSSAGASTGSCRRVGGRSWPGSIPLRVGRSGDPGVHPLVTIHPGGTALGAPPVGGGMAAGGVW
jgi:hypothetical protein